MSNPTQSGGKARRTPFSQGTRTHPRVARQAKPGGVRPAAHERFCGRAIVAHPAHDARSTRAARGARRSVRRFDEVRLCQKKQTFWRHPSHRQQLFYPPPPSLVRDSARNWQTGKFPSKMRFFPGVGRSLRIKIQSRLHRRSFFGSARSTDLNTTIGETAFAIETESANREPGISRQSRSPGNSVRTRRPALIKLVPFGIASAGGPFDVSDGRLGQTRPLPERQVIESKGRSPGRRSPPDGGAPNP